MERCSDRCGEGDIPSCWESRWPGGRGRAAMGDRAEAGGTGGVGVPLTRLRGVIHMRAGLRGRHVWRAVRESQTFPDT